MKSLALLLLLAAPAAAGGPHYLTIVKAGCEAPAACREDSYGALEKMVQLADAQGVKLTLLFSDAYAQFVSSVPARHLAVQGWKAKGHELGAWHRGADPALAGGAPLPALSGLAGGVKTGCTGLADAAQRAPFEVCAAGASGGSNRFLVPAADGRKAIHSFEPAGRSGVAAAKKQFAAMKSGVYSAAFTASPESFGAFYAWLGYLKEQDGAGGLSRTAAQAAEAKLLPEKKAGAAAPAAKKDGCQAKNLPAQPGLPAAPAAADTLAGGTPIPKMVPKPSRFSMVERIFFGHRGGGRDFRPGSAPSRRGEPGYRPPGGIPAYLVGRCGDGICQPSERRGPAACPRDCK